MFWQKIRERRLLTWVKTGSLQWIMSRPYYTLDNVDFKSGLNTQTYLYEINFAAKHGMPYVNMDAWSSQ